MADVSIAYWGYDELNNCNRIERRGELKVGQGVSAKPNGGATES